MAKQLVNLVWEDGKEFKIPSPPSSVASSFPSYLQASTNGSLSWDSKVVTTDRKTYPGYAIISTPTGSWTTMRINVYDIQMMIQGTLTLVMNLQHITSKSIPEVSNQQITIDALMNYLEMSNGSIGRPATGTFKPSSSSGTTGVVVNYSRNGVGSMLVSYVKDGASSSQAFTKDTSCFVSTKLRYLYPN